MSTAASVFDPFAPGFTEDPYPHYARLRAAGPALEHPLGFWLVSRHADVAALQRSAHSVDEQHLRHLPAWKSGSAEVRKESRVMGGLSMLDQDPPDHTRLRRLVSKAFTPRSIEALQPRVEELVAQALARIAAAGTADVVAELAFPLPFTIISEMLGIPVGDHTRLRELTEIVVLVFEPFASPETQARIRAANQELFAMVRELIRWKRDNPGDDLLTALIEAEHDGDMLSEDELISQVMFLYIAGHETTVTHLASGILSLLRNPEQADRLRTETELAVNAVDELMRFDTPVHLMRRITVAPLAIGDVEIPAGSWVIGALAAANRDPDFWGADADELRLDRPTAHRNVALGAGIHHCLGAALVRMEARIVFPRFVARFPDATVDELTWNGRINLRGLSTLTVTV
ncbi:cytochrome P450 [Nocardia mangyaensis]|uniref:cytochrome P450 n=1 Tax=Nocardia mangyaensis TaxID=2213200 RepID=UPI0026757C61|nr:cytochrome P450 [Nocardia mangyaensis]MDO3648410.1 cytochrome P450 [Nocardia mangyaensis]